MISAQFSKVLNDVWSNKTRTLLIILSIFVGLTAVGTVRNARTLLSQSIDLAYDAAGYSHGLVITGQPFDKNFIRSIADVEGVAAVDARRTLTAQAVDGNNQRHSLAVFTVPDYDTIQVNRITPVSGAWPAPERQTLIENGALAVLGAQVGDILPVELPGGDMRRLKIAGTASDLSQPPAVMAGSAYGYVDAETMEWLGQPSGFNQLYFTVASRTRPGAEPTKAEIEQVLRRVVDKAEKAGYIVASSQVVAEIPINSMTEIVMYILTGIGGLSLFLSFFLIINTVSAMVTQQTRQIGVMKAVGGRGGQILWMYLLVVISYGLIALLMSAPLSVLGGKLLSQYICSMFNITVVGSPVQPTSLVIQTVIALLGPTLASLLPLSNGLRISATQALSGEGGPGSDGRGLIDRLLSGRSLWFARYILLRPIVLALRNMFRRKIRLGLTLATLVLAGAVFITIFNLRATIASALDQMTQMQAYDLTVNFHRPYRVDELQQVFAAIPEVQAVDTWLVTGARRVRPDGSESGPIAVTGVRLDSDVIASPMILAGRWLAPGDANALVVTSSLLQNEPDLEVGQEIVLRLNGRDIPFRIVGSSMVMAAGLGGDTAYASYPYLAGLASNDTQAASVMVKLAPNLALSDTALAGRIEGALKDKGLRVASIETSREQRNNMRNNFTSVLVVLVLMALLLALVGGMGLMGTMSINVLERTREIGVLRAIGASNRGVNGVFMLEGVSIGIGSCLFAIPLSYPITDLVASAIGSMATGNPWTSAYTASGVLVWAVLVTLLSLVANYLPARNASRLTVREVLAYE